MRKRTKKRKERERMRREKGPDRERLLLYRNRKERLTGTKSPLILYSKLLEMKMKVD